MKRAPIDAIPTTAGEWRPASIARHCRREFPDAMRAANESWARLLDGEQVDLMEGALRGLWRRYGLPLSSQGLDQEQETLGLQVGRVAATVVAAEGWRTTRGVYDLRPALFRRLWESGGALRMPPSALDRLPQPCLYVRFPEEVRPYHALGFLKGTFVFQGWASMPDGRGPLRALYLLSDFDSGRDDTNLAVTDLVPLPLTGGTVGNSLGTWYRGDVHDPSPVPAFDAEDPAGHARYVARLVSVALALCDERVTITPADGVAGRPEQPELVFKKGKKRLRGAREIRRYNVS